MTTGKWEEGDEREMLKKLKELYSAEAKAQGIPLDTQWGHIAEAYKRLRDNTVGLYPSALLETVLNDYVEYNFTGLRSREDYVTAVNAFSQRAGGASGADGRVPPGKHRLHQPEGIPKATPTVSRDVNEMDEMEQAPKAGPKHKIRLGAVCATVWENKFAYQGKTIVNQSVSISRAYKDKEDKWKDTKDLRLNDIPKAIEALREAYVYLLKSGKGDSAVQKAEDVEAFL